MYLVVMCHNMYVYARICICGHYCGCRCVLGLDEIWMDLDYNLDLDKG